MRSPMQSTVQLFMASERVSKSNMGGVSMVAASTEAIGLIKIAPDIGPHPVLERREAAVIAGPAQAIDLAAGEILVAVADRHGHVDILDIGMGAECSIGREDKVLETARLTGSDIEETGDGRRRQQPHDDPHDILDIDE